MRGAGRSGPGRAAGLIGAPIADPGAACRLVDATRGSAPYFNVSDDPVWAPHAAAAGAGPGGARAGRPYPLGFVQALGIPLEPYQDPRAVVALWSGLRVAAPGVYAVPGLLREVEAFAGITAWGAAGAAAARVHALELASHADDIMHGIEVPEEVWDPYEPFWSGEDPEQGPPTAWWRQVLAQNGRAFPFFVSWHRDDVTRREFAAVLRVALWTNPGAAEHCGDDAYAQGLTDAELRDVILRLGPARTLQRWWPGAARRRSRPWPPRRRRGRVGAAGPAPAGRGGPGRRRRGGARDAVVGSSAPAPATTGPTRPVAPGSDAGAARGDGGPRGAAVWRRVGAGAGRARLRAAVIDPPRGLTPGLLRVLRAARRREHLQNLLLQDGDGGDADPEFARLVAAI